MSVQKTRLLTLLFFVLAVAMRFMPHEVNFTAIGALALYAGCHLSAVQGILLGLGAIAVSDTIGHLTDFGHISYYNRPTMLAVYAGFALPGLLGLLVRKTDKTWSVPLAAVSSSALFFILTNFACWLDPMMGFERNLGGLVKCYFDAIPFARNEFLGTLIFSCAFFGAHAWVERRASVTEVANAR